MLFYERMSIREIRGTHTDMHCQGSKTDALVSGILKNLLEVRKDYTIENNVNMTLLAS